MTLLKVNSNTYARVEESFQRFCDGTNLHGFHDLGHSKTMFWKIVWWIILLLSTAITIYLIVYTVHEYTNQESITRVLPPDKGEVVYPTMGVCYTHWIYWVDWDTAYRLGFSKSAILYGLSFLGKIFSREEFNRNDAKQDFVNSMKKNGFEFVTQFYEAIARNFSLIIGIFPDYPTLQTDPFIFKTKKIIYKEQYLFCYLLSGSEIAKEMNVEKGDITKSRASRNLFNFSFQDPNYSLYKTHISYEEYNYYIAYWLCYMSNYWILTLDEFSKNYTSFTMPVQLYTDINADEFVTLKTDNDEYNIKLSPTVQRSRNTKQDPCLEHEKALFTDQACKYKCKANMDNQNSFCTFVDEAALYTVDTVDLLCSYPINFLTHQRENPSYRSFPCDNFIPYDKWDTNRTSETIRGPLMQNQTISDEQLELDYNDCSAKCQKACEIWKYSITVNILTGSKTALENSFKNQTNINIFYPIEDDILVVIDIDAQSWEDFVASVGGLLGIFTGASMISFLQIPYLCCLTTIEFGCDYLMGYRKSASVIKIKNRHRKERAIHILSDNQRRQNKQFKIASNLNSNVLQVAQLAIKDTEKQQSNRQLTNTDIASIY